MKSKLTGLIITGLILLSSKAVLALEYDAQPLGEVDCDGKGAVWASYLNNNWEVFYADLSRNSQEQLTADSFHQVNPSIWDETVVWQDDRDGTYEIYQMNVNSNSPQKISSLPGDNVEPIVRAGYVIWINEKDGYRNLVVYNRSSKTQEIVTDKISIYGLDFDGEYAVWNDSRNGNFDIYYYDLGRGMEERATFYSGDELDPNVSEGKIVFSLEYEGTRHIHEYDIAAQEESKLTVGDINHDILAFSQGQLILKRGNEIFLEDTSTTVKKEMAMSGYKMPASAFLSGDQVVWLDYEGIKTEDIDTALERAEERPKGYIPPTGSGSGESDMGVATYKEYAIEAVKGQEIRYDLESGRLRISINGADVLSDGEIKVIETASQAADGLMAVSMTYQLAAPANIIRDHSARFIVNYANYAEGADIRIYQTDGNPKALSITRDKGINSISAVINNNAKVSAMLFIKQYNDILNHWGKQYIEDAAAQQIVNGYADGTIKPDNRITRAEFVRILVNIFAGENPASVSSGGFTDSVGHWAERDLKIAQEKGWLTGYNGKAFPNSQITREEMITMLMRIPAAEIRNSDILLTQFTDQGTISDWSKEYIQKAVTEGIIQGNEGKVSPKANATRAESITMIYRYLDNRNMI